MCVHVHPFSGPSHSSGHPAVSTFILVGCVQGPGTISAVFPSAHDPFLELLTTDKAVQPWALEGRRAGVYSLPVLSSSKPGLAPP